MAVCIRNLIRQLKMKSRSSKILGKFIRTTLSAVLALSFAAPQAALAEQPAKQVFGRLTLPAALKPASHGFYSKGCLAGAVAMPTDGPTWQTMRLSRNRRWGHPALIGLLEDLSIKASKSGWNGLLIGDISQPRGGPMLTGHASHQIGLDADIWLTPMPNRRLTFREREDTSAISVLKSGTPYVDDRRWNKSYENLLRHAASYNQVERLLVHPGIKKKLCDTVKGDRSWLQKVRPYYGHHYHFHVRIACQPGSSGCKSQAPTAAGTGCDASLDWWFDVALAPKKKTAPKKPATKPKPKPEITLSNLPQACGEVVNASATSVRKAEYQAASLAGFVAPKLDMPSKIDPLAVLSSKPIEASKSKGSGNILATASTGADPFAALLKTVDGPLPVPTPRPLR